MMGGTQRVAVTPCASARSMGPGATCRIPSAAWTPWPENHSIAGIAQPPQTGIDAVLAHRAGRVRIDGNTNPAGPVTACTSRSSSTDCRDKGDVVRLAHFHLARRIDPERAIQIKPTPFGMAQFARAHIGMWRDLQGQLGNAAATPKVGIPTGLSSE